MSEVATVRPPTTEMRVSPWSRRSRRNASARSSLVSGTTVIQGRSATARSESRSPSGAMIRNTGTSGTLNSSDRSRLMRPRRDSDDLRRMTRQAELASERHDLGMPHREEHRSSQRSPLRRARHRPRRATGLRRSDGNQRDRRREWLGPARRCCRRVIARTRARAPAAQAADRTDRNRRRSAVASRDCRCVCSR